MGYLEILGGGLDVGVSDFSKAIFSLWFRFPAASVVAAQAQFNSANVPNGIDNNGGSFPSVLLGKIPLVVFGPNPTASTSGDAFSASQQISPSFIGINCGMYVLNDTGVPDAIPTLCAQLAYEGQDVTFTTLTGATFTLPNRFEIGYHGGNGTFFEFNPQTGGRDAGLPVTSERWHHLIVSFDVSHSGTCQFWWALDDANYNGDYLYPALVPGGPNDVQSSAAETKPNGPLQVSSHPFGIPCTGENVAWVYQVEMAEFQLYTGITLDTGVTGNRRLFVTMDGKPADQGVAQTALGRPAIYLGGSSLNWIHGSNSGSAGDFTPVGTITDYTLNPGL